MLRQAAFGALVVTLALVTTTMAGAERPAAIAQQSPAATASFISKLKSTVCGFLDGVETVELPTSLFNFVKGGELEASTVLLFGVNQKLCGGGHVEKLFSLAHDYLLGAVTHDYTGFGTLKSQLPSLVP